METNTVNEAPMDRKNGYALSSSFFQKLRPLPTIVGTLLILILIVVGIGVGVTVTQIKTGGEVKKLYFNGRFYLRP